jgi:hypothetical protein
MTVAHGPSPARIAAAHPIRQTQAPNAKTPTTLR